jgi:hypothetical protein
VTATPPPYPTLAISMEIRIVNVPPGEAPEAIRRAWVGLVLPLAPREKGPRALAAFGVVAGPRGLLGTLWRLFTGRYTRGVQYAVPVDAAIAALEEASPDAAAWWREKTPHLIGRSRTFGFAAEVCEEIAESI